MISSCQLHNSGFEKSCHAIIPSPYIHIYIHKRAVCLVHNRRFSRYLPRPRHQLLDSFPWNRTKDVSRFDFDTLPVLESLLFLFSFLFSTLMHCFGCRQGNKYKGYIYVRVSVGGSRAVVCTIYPLPLSLAWIISPCVCCVCWVLGCPLPFLLGFLMICAH